MVVLSNTPPAERWMGDVKAVAQRLGVCRSTVLNLDRLGGIPKSVKLSRARRWDMGVIESWIAAGCPKMNEAAKQAQPETGK